MEQFSPKYFHSTEGYKVNLICDWHCRQVPKVQPLSYETWWVSLHWIVPCPASNPTDFWEQGVQTPAGARLGWKNWERWTILSSDIGTQLLVTLVGVVCCVHIAKCPVLARTLHFWRVLVSDLTHSMIDPLSRYKLCWLQWKLQFKSLKVCSLLQTWSVAVYEIARFLAKCMCI